MHHASFKSYVVVCALTVFAFAATSHPVSAQPNVDARPNVRKDPRDTIPRSAYNDRIDILSVGVEYVASAGGGTFFPEYQKLGGMQSDLGTYLAPNISGRIAIADNLRLVVN